MNEPSTAWQEAIQPGEDKRFARLAERMKQAHIRLNRRHGKGRFLHRKETLGAEGHFEVYSDLPDAARYGVFREPRLCRALIRFSNGSPDIAANSRPDIRGFAVRILDQSGQAALNGTTDHQDFLLINHDHLTARDSRDFVEIAVRSSRGYLPLFWYLLRRDGIRGVLPRLRELNHTLAKPFRGYAADRFDTVLPHKVGPFAARILLKPMNPRPAQMDDFIDDFAAKLAIAPISYELALQFYLDEERTPLEDHRRAWDEEVSPPLPVGRLTIERAGADIDGVGFDPWSGLEAHRPLGEIMRARKLSYQESRKARL